MNRPKTKLMIVEDEAIVAMELEIELTERGFEVIGKAMSSEQAVELARLESPDIILMDVSLKGNRDGIETSKDILKLCDASILFVSAYTDTETEIRMKQIPGSNFLSKPFTINELLKKIEETLS